MRNTLVSRSFACLIMAVAKLVVVLMTAFLLTQRYASGNALQWLPGRLPWHLLSARSHRFAHPSTDLASVLGTLRSKRRARLLYTAGPFHMYKISVTEEPYVQ